MNAIPATTSCWYLCQTTGKPQGYNRRHLLKKKAARMQTTLARGPRTKQPNTHPMGLLSKLPGELRNQIYQYVLAGNNVHIDCRSLFNAVVHPSERLNVYTANGQTYGISATICKSPSTDSDAYAQTKLPKREDSTVLHYEGRHAACLRPHRSAERNKLSIGLLKTCRQIHNEAISYLYADNTFSFKCPEDLDLFISLALRPHSTHTLIRSLRLHCETTRYRDPFLTLSHLDTLTDLRFFGLMVADYYKPYGVPELPRICTERLECVEVMIGPKPFHAKGNRTEAWRGRYHAVEFEGRLWGRGKSVGYDCNRACLEVER